MMNKENANLEQFINTSQSNRISSAKNHTSLSPREREVMRWLTFSYTYKEIAKAMDLSPKTIEHYVDNIKLKLGLYRKSAIVQYVLRNNLLLELAGPIPI